MFSFSFCNDILTSMRKFVFLVIMFQILVVFKPFDLLNQVSFGVVSIAFKKWGYGTACRRGVARRGRLCH